MKYPSALLLLCFFLNTHVTRAQQDQDLQKFYADKIKTNGVIVSTDVTGIPYVDIDRISVFNFDQYRHYDSRHKVKLISGPIVELISIKERMADGKIVADSIVAKQKDIAQNTYKHEVMPKVDVHLGYKPPVKMREKTLIYMTPKDTQ